MKTIEMEIALMKYIGVRDQLIIPNVHWGMKPGNSRPLHECDLLILSRSNYATEIEIKVSRDDLRNDMKKPHAHRHPYIKYLFYAVPVNLLDYALEIIPKRAGLYSVRSTFRTGTKLIRKAEATSQVKQWSVEDRYNLARLGAMRILSLKEKVLKNATSK